MKILGVATLLMLATHSMAQTTPFDHLTDAEGVSAMCSAMPSAEHDLFKEFSGRPGDVVVECGRLKPELTIIAHPEEIAEIPFADTLGARLLERHNKWGVSPQRRVYMSIVNPYPVALAGVIIRYYDGPCGAGDGVVYQMLFNEPIRPEATNIIGFAKVLLSSNDGDSCIDIVDALPVLNTWSELRLSEASALSRARQWRLAGLQLELAERIGKPASEGLLTNIQEIVRRDVRSIPASKALENRNGYDFLLALEPENQDYAARLERYQRASYNERLRALMEGVLEASSVVVIRQVINGLSPEQSRSQRDSAWGNFNEKMLVVEGRVTGANPKGFLNNASIEIELGSNTSVSCIVKDFLNNSITDIPVGSRVECVGTLSNYILLFGELSLFVTDAEYSRQ